MFEKEAKERAKEKSSLYRNAIIAVKNVQRQLLDDLCPLVQ